MFNVLYNNMNHSQPTSQLRDYPLDTQALMQAKHDPTIVFLNRLFSSWEFRLYYIVTSILAIGCIIYCCMSESLLIEILTALLLYIITAFEIAGRIRLVSAPDYFKQISHLLEVTGSILGLIILAHRVIVGGNLLKRAIPFIVIIGRNVWEYSVILREDRERRQTKERAREELSFESLDDPVHIEMTNMNK